MLAGLEGHREKCVCGVCFQLWLPKGQSSLLFTEGPQEQSPWHCECSQRLAFVQGCQERTQPAGICACEETPSLCQVFSHKHPHGFVKTCFSEARTQKAKVHGEAMRAHASPGMEHVCIIYLLEFYVFM